MTPDRSLKILRIASVLALVALALMTWSLFDPTPAPVLIALSIGQAIGTASFAAFGFVVYMDLRRIQRERRRAASMAPPSSRPELDGK